MDQGFELDKRNEEDEQAGHEGGTWQAYSPRIGVQQWGSHQALQDPFSAVEFGGASAQVHRVAEVVDGEVEGESLQTGSKSYRMQGNREREREIWGEIFIWGH